MRLANTAFQLSNIECLLPAMQASGILHILYQSHTRQIQGHHPWYFSLKKWKRCLMCVVRSPDCSVFICNCKVAALDTCLPLRRCALTHCRQHVSARCHWVTWWHEDVTVTKHSWAEEREQQSVCARWDRSNTMNVKERNWNWMIDLIVPISNSRKIPSASSPWVDVFLHLRRTSVFFYMAKKKIK